MCSNPACAGLGCPIRRSPDQSLLGGSPRLIAACYVLHRLLKSRHPPCACVTAILVVRETSVSCETRAFRTFGCRSGSFYKIGIASPTLLCLPPSLAFRNFEEKQQALIVKVTFCGNGNLRNEDSTFRHKEKIREKKRRGSPSSYVMPIIANETTLSSRRSEKTRAPEHSGLLRLHCGFI